MARRRYSAMPNDFLASHKFSALDEICPRCSCSREYIEDSGLSCDQASRKLQTKNAQRPHILSDDSETLNPHRAPEATKLCRTIKNTKK